ncbi:hypothetical protein T190115A13A_30105 [Tenacibaculum sp. 190524A02b]|uniref:Uncharacterized protein n=1 Tax=Tenacibaculum vairaonense TaxID=3137860 RepID=A0ABP1FFA4_9FLAO
MKGLMLINLNICKIIVLKISISYFFEVFICSLLFFSWLVFCSGIDS